MSGLPEDHDFLTVHGPGSESPDIDIEGTLKELRREVKTRGISTERESYVQASGLQADKQFDQTLSESLDSEYVDPVISRNDVLSTEPRSAAERKFQPEHCQMPPSPSKRETLGSNSSATATTEVEQGDDGATLAEINSKLKTKFEASQTECDILRRQVLVLRKNLQEQQDFIFSLQPHQVNITETEAKSEFVSLCGAIEEWVDTYLGDSIQDRAMVKKKILVGPGRRLLDLIPQSGWEGFKYPDTDERNIAAAIMRFLCVNVFNPEFFGPISKGEIEFLYSLQRSMKNLSPSRSLRARRAWRSETYTALTHLPDFVPRLKGHAESLTTELAEMLGLFVPHYNKYKLRATIRGSIVDPALSLAQKTNLSIDIFDIQWTEFSTAHPQRQPAKTYPFRERFDNFEMINLMAAGKKIKTLPPTGDVDYVLDIMPKFVMRTTKADVYGEAKVLKKPKLLVAISIDDQPRMLPIKSSGEEETLLGFLDRTVRDREGGRGLLSRNIGKR